MAGPKVFVGSSSEGKAVAYYLQGELEGQTDCEVTVWTQGVFRPSAYVLPQLVAHLNEADFAVLVATRDDELTKRSLKTEAVRDNVLFELGLSLGALGLERTLVLEPRSADPLPTDLWGLGTVQYDSARDNVRAALGPAAREISDVIESLGPRRVLNPPASSAVSARSGSVYSHVTTPVVTDGLSHDTSHRRPPWQPSDPPPALDYSENPHLPNRIRIPDARPVGVAFLDAFGPPRTAGPYPRLVPLMQFTGARGNLPGDNEEVDPYAISHDEPHSGLNFFYFDGTNSLQQPTADIVITAYDDSAAVLARLKEGANDHAVLFDYASVDWPGHTGDDDFLLVTRDAGSMQYAGALMRQGDYLIGITIGSRTIGEAVTVATEIAEKCAANLGFLDPEHASSR